MHSMYTTPGRIMAPSHNTTGRKWSHHSSAILLGLEGRPTQARWPAHNEDDVLLPLHGLGRERQGRWREEKVGGGTTVTLLHTHTTLPPPSPIRISLAPHQHLQLLMHPHLALLLESVSALWVAVSQPPAR